MCTNTNVPHPFDHWYPSALAHYGFQEITSDFADRHALFSNLMALALLTHEFFLLLIVL